MLINYFIVSNEQSSPNVLVHQTKSSPNKQIEQMSIDISQSMETFYLHKKHI